jgi:hypothetical protein
VAAPSRRLRFGEHPGSLLGHPYALAPHGPPEELIRMPIAMIGGSVLDVGCVSMPYRYLYLLASRCKGGEIRPLPEAVNTLAPHSHDDGHFPLESVSFAAFLCAQALEHGSPIGTQCFHL